MKPTDEMVNRFLAWPVPADVHPDGTPGQPGRIGTNLLSAAQAREMLAHVLDGPGAHEVKTYPDGTVASGPGPLPEQSPTDTHFLQPKITGYRQLSEKEVALMNEGKALAEQCGAYIANLRGLGHAGLTLDQRWISIGATHLQEGFMAVTRGIAQPTTF